MHSGISLNKCSLILLISVLCKLQCAFARNCTIKIHVYSCFMCVFCIEGHSAPDPLCPVSQKPAEAEYMFSTPSSELNLAPACCSVEQMHCLCVWENLWILKCCTEKGELLESLGWWLLDVRCSDWSVLVQEPASKCFVAALIFPFCATIKAVSYSDLQGIFHG